MGFPVLDFPPEVLALIVRRLEWEEYARIRTTCHVLYNECPLDEMKWLVRRMSAPTKLKEEQASKSGLWALSQALFILFRRHGLRRDLRILIEHGAQFHGLQGGLLLREVYARHGPGKRLSYLFANGAQFSYTPGGINQVLEDDARQQHWHPARTYYLLQNGASFANVPSGCEQLISDLIQRQPSSKSLHYLQERRKIYFVLSRAGKLAYTPANLANHLINVYLEFGMNPRTLFLLNRITDGTTILLVHCIKGSSEYWWITLGAEVASLLRRRANDLEMPLDNLDDNESAVLAELLRESPDVNSNHRIWKALLLWAASWNRADLVRSLLQKGIDIEEADSSQLNALLVAIHKGHLEVLKSLLAADQFSHGSYFDDPLVIACSHNQDKIAEILLHNGFDPNSRDKHGRAPLCVAALCGNKHLVKLLLENGADPNIVVDPWVPLRPAYVNTGAPECLLQWGERKLKEQTYTPLLAAYNHPEVIKMLLENGANLSTTQNTVSAIVLWSTSDAPESVKTLLTYGAGQFNHKTLCEAAYLGKPKMLEVLLEHGGAELVNERNDVGETVLHCASESKSPNLETVRILSSHGAIVNAVDNSGRTPLHRASENGALDIARFLIGRGADLSIRDKDGLRPIDCSTDPQARIALRRIEKAATEDLSKLSIASKEDPQSPRR